VPVLPLQRRVASLSLRVGGVACAAALGLAPRAAWAENREINPLGNEAALSGGAVVALGRDTGSIYYNPAGLGAVRRTQFNLSTQALQLRARVIPYAVTALLDHGARDGATLSSFQLLLMPSSLAVTRHLGRGVTVGVGYFAPDYDYYDYGASIDSQKPNAGYRARVQVDGWVYRYHAGPSIGWQPHPRFRIGMSLLFTYGWRREEGRLWMWSAEGPKDKEIEASLVTDLDSKRSIYGGEAVFGLQWEMIKNLHFGLSVRTPRFVAYETHKIYALTVANHHDPSRDSRDLFSFDDVPGKPQRGRVAPMRITAGLAYALPRRLGWISVEGDFSPKLRLPHQESDIRAVANARVGARLRTAENLFFGIGAFTDHADEVRTGNFPHFRMNYYGVSSGVEFLSPVTLGKRERARTIVFSTCIAVRYAYGRGSATRVDLDFSRASEGILSYGLGTIEPVAFHLLAGHLGMGTYF
jgi:hypothetical protein